MCFQGFNFGDNRFEFQTGILTCRIAKDGAGSIHIAGMERPVVPMASDLSITYQ